MRWVTRRAAGWGLVLATAVAVSGCSSSSSSSSPANPSGGSSSAASSAPPTPSPTEQTPSIRGVTVVSGLPHDHFYGALTYSRTPPLGGDHNPIPLNCGVYSEPVPNENAVHDLEHGAVWLTYTAGVDPAPLVDLAKIDPAYVLVSPYPGQPAPVIATAWGLQLKVSSATDPRLRAFVEQYHGGGQGGEKGAACAGVTLAQAKQLLARGAPAGQATPPNPADQAGTS